MGTDRVRVGESAVEGRGLFAVVPIQPGEPIFDEAEGDDPSDVLMTDEEFRAFVATVEKYSARAIGGGLHRVSMNPENIVNYGNHSCDPNTWLADDKVTLVARRVIPVGEEVTSDYALWSDTAEWHMECNCGTTMCRGVITGQDWKRSDLQSRYRGHWPAFLEDRIADPGQGEQ